MECSNLNITFEPFLSHRSVTLMAGVLFASYGRVCVEFSLARETHRSPKYHPSYSQASLWKQ